MIAKNAWRLRLLGLLGGVLFLVGCATSGSVSAGEGNGASASRTAGALFDDNALKRIAVVNVRRAHEDLLTANLAITSFNGVVLLAGQVPNAEMKSLAETEVLKLKRARRVYNELEIGEATSMLTRSRDVWLTGKVKAQLLASDEVRGTGVKVVTENGSTYLMGLVTRAEADQATEVARNVSGVRQVVRLFEYVD